jgi:hypothetical protein
MIYDINCTTRGLFVVEAWNVIWGMGRSPRAAYADALKHIAVDDAPDADDLCIYRSTRRLWDEVQAIGGDGLSLDETPGGALTLAHKPSTPAWLRARRAHARASSRSA